MTTIPNLETERLILRAPEGHDFALYRKFYADAEGSGNYGGPLRSDEAYRKLCYDLGHWYLQGFGKWIVERREDGVAVGGCGIVHPIGWPSHELTWWLLPEYRGHGYAAEASRAVIRFACQTLRWPGVETHLRDENEAARKLAQSLGGTVIRRETFPDGVTRDVFALPEPAAEPA
ncbi:GNAT family N-acetyltransferase [Algicella marina]|uniref:GNAT family N-acetyltransferase n=1 Tax=Algicella marina TaxID=2683284 RepID=A0A6P1T363_9RHOB|nr:GNAT family N-acetyltransferase [Algicella marina]QHQ35749.1 GNAT family N-acetyltransferase [Algicella marina]